MNREGQSEWRMDVPDSRAGLAPLGCRDCESGGLWWLDQGHDVDALGLVAKAAFRASDFYLEIFTTHTTVA